jgi:hypothetical protein
MGVFDSSCKAGAYVKLKPGGSRSQQNQLSGIWGARCRDRLWLGQDQGPTIYRSIYKNCLVPSFAVPADSLSGRPNPAWHEAG